MKEFTAKTDLGIICAQIIGLRAEVAALTEFISKNSSPEEKTELKKSIIRITDEMADDYRMRFGTKED